MTDNNDTISLWVKIWTGPFLAVGWVAGIAIRGARLARAALVTGFEAGTGATE